MTSPRALVLLSSLLACDASPASDPPAVALPALEACDAVRDWNPDLVAQEQEMLAALRERRARGNDCGTRGTFAPSDTLRLDGALTCAARLHALDMAAQGFVDHDGSDEQSPWDRLHTVGYRFATADQAIVAADLTIEDILDEIWLARDGSCATLSAESYTEVGIGAALPFDPEDPVAGLRWSVVMARPLDG